MLKNIFKKTKSRKKPTKPQPLPHIIIDIHEKNSLVPSYLKDLKTDIEFTSLKIGDYLINKIAIERKTFSDLFSSMINKRLVQQLKHLRQYKQPMLIIEGRDYDLTKNPNSIRGLILSILLNYQIPIIFTQDAEETATYLHLLAKQQLKPFQPITLHSRIPKTKKEQQKYILESFPNIGPTTAEKLLKKFKTISNVMNATEEELKPILKSRTNDFLSLIQKK